MNKIVSLITSPRKPSNGELLCKAVLKELGKEWYLKIIRLIEWDIKPCKACYSCLFEGCSQKDGMEKIIEEIIDSDIAIITTPTYFLGANSTLKRFIDRGLMFYNYIEKLWNKPMVGIVTAGIEGMEGYAKLMVDSAIKILGGNLLGSFVIYGAFPGEVVLGEENLKKIKIISELIKQAGQFKGEKKKEAICPLCGGDSFRFLEDGKVRCLLCSHSGSYRWHNGKLLFDIQKGFHDLFLSLEDTITHKEWLRNMKKRFLEVRKELKSVIQQYSHEENVTYITPKE